MYLEGLHLMGDMMFEIYKSLQTDSLFSSGGVENWLTYGKRTNLWFLDMGEQ